MARITGALAEWDDLLDEISDFPTLLFGNGTSINISSAFSYTSLYAEAGFSAVVAEVFSELETKNFEAVLEGLWHAQLVLKAMGRSTRAVDALYDEVREALVAAVREVHVRWEDVPLSTFRQFARELNRHHLAFTTNYDLLPYWSLMADDTVRIADLFWSGGTFDPDHAEVWDGWTTLLYLHGGVHLWQDAGTGIAGKWTNSGGGLLRSLGSRFTQSPQRQPLFVSEGTPRHKRRTIRRSEYLSHALATLRNDDADTVIIGSSLSSPDAHVVDALLHGGRRHFAVGIRPKAAREVMVAKAAIIERLPGQNIHFFDLESHPLGDPSLTI